MLLHHPGLAIHHLLDGRKDPKKAKPIKRTATP